MIHLPRYYSYTDFEEAFLKVVQKLPQDFYAFSFLGSSVDNKSIYGLQLGHGDFKILAWSQMHGNESTTTRAILQLLQDPKLDELLAQVTLYIIPVLNPDGADLWTRFNANTVDLNRDAVHQSQPESQILAEAVEFFEPDLALNLHGQRTIYGVEGQPAPCQLSFLTPSSNELKTVDSTRLRSMAIIVEVSKAIKGQLQGAVGRYDDSFNGNCWGDYLQSMGIPTILFEAGHAGSDYSRDLITSHIATSLKEVLLSVTRLSSLNDEVLEDYESIPEVRKNYVDILIKNVGSINGKSTLAVMYHEQLRGGVLEFVPMLYAINESSIWYGHRIIDLAEQDNYQNDLTISADMQVHSESLNIRPFIN